MYQYVFNLLPTIFDGMFIKNRDIHSHSTRHSHYFWLPSCRTTKRHNNLTFFGARLWNEFIIKYVDLNKTKTIYAFKRVLRKVLLTNYEDD